MTAPAGKVLFIDDDDALRAAAVQGLDLAGFEVTAFDNGPAALKALSRDFPGVVVSDVRMPGMDGLALFARIQAIDPDIPVLLITGHGDVAMAVAALKDGVYDFVSKPFPMERLAAALARALEKRSLVLDNRRLEAAATFHGGAGSPLLGEAPVMQRLRATIAQLAEAEVDVLIQGETGVGKDLIAQALHRGGPRRARPMVTVNCAALPEAVFEAELFGVTGGAAGGRPRIGRLEHADRGVLFLDEIEGLTPAMQAKLLRVVEEREIWPIGAAEPRHLDFRIIAAGKIDLVEPVREGLFRADLYYRLNVVTLVAPPLRERREDVPMLFGHFLAEAAARFRRPVPHLTAAVRDHLLGHDWPGNVRELAHYAERVALGLSSAITPEAGTGDQADGLAERVERYEAMAIRETLAACNGDARAAMALLRTPRKTFYDKLRRHGIEIDAYRPSRRGPRP
ncbi:sigma-54 dependent transcriptional regulator [Caulobacter sp. BK020]|uniref:sigma-54-dependent transcriptional regulator n=1 Tax=Caulobacter sp. BK020 TaxID=2512117 RepID=UPI001045A3E4|nr:sigma-54 dependent transcriptional regulator [Caulobacter sp. BK020]TCS16630.1 two-component system C4-dicarboxylate transport response regulator DctD [Caulobacter sp. BK020]